MSNKNDRKSAIAAAASKKKKGSLKERLDNATAPGIVKPSKPAPVRIPSALNLVNQQPVVEDAVVQTEGTVHEFAAKHAKRPAPAKASAVEAPDEAPEVLADKELDTQVESAAKAKKEKPAKDPNLLSVSDIAREVGVDPKRARARLRAAGRSAADGRWPLVARDSQEHQDIAALIAADAPKADPKPDVAG